MKFLLLTILICSINLMGQDKYGVLNIDSEVKGAVVYLDSALIGSTPISNFKVKVGTYTLKVKNPEPTDWLEQDIVQKIGIKENDTLNLFITFEKFIKINSIPFSANILLGDSIIGTTPSIFKMKDLLGEKIKIVKKGHNEVEILIDGKTQRIEVNLSPKNGAETELRTEPRNKLNVVLPIAGISLTSGIISIYFKTQADKLYNEYLQSGDPEKLNTVKTYDKVAGVTLVIFEITAILAIYLLIKN